MAGPSQDRWIAVDWGTSQLRAWLMEPDGRDIDRRDSDRGMAVLEPGGFEPALLSLIEDWLEPEGATLVVACGMVGARQGWAEAAYAPVPCAPLADGRFTRAPAADPRLDVRILPGLMQADPPDVMRGEETQIAGFLATEPGFAGLVCLPGTHTKWAEIRGGRVLRFRTVMTGELFGLLAQKSVLRHSVGAGWDEAAFDAGLEVGAEALGHLFALRAAALIGDLAPAAARARLSGLLIGAELAAVDPGQRPVVIIGGADLAGHYARALARVGAEARLADAGEAVLAGLRMARETHR